MAATNFHTTSDSTARNLIGALYDARNYGLTETVLGTTITSTGTIAKLRAAIAAFTVHETEKRRLQQILAKLDQAEDEGCIVNANVESARAASSGSRFSTLITAISGRADLVAAADPSDWQVR